MELAIAIAHISTYSALLPLLLILRRRNPPTAIRILIVLIICSFVFDLVSYTLATKAINTYPINNLFSLVQTILLLIIYCVAFSWPARFVYWSGGIYAIVFFIDYLAIEGPYKLNSYTYATSGLFLITLSLLYFRFLLKNLPETYVYRSPVIWINIAVLLYFSGNLFLFMFYNYFFTTGVWILHNILNITKNLLFFVAIWQSQRKINSISS